MDDPDVFDDGRNETPEQRADRNLTELLGELRVALPGVQVLFAFLLVVPFNQRFNELSDFEQKLYFATLMATAVASMLLIAPSVHHRVLFRMRDKEHLVRTANRLTIAGLSVLALAMSAAIFLITHVLFGWVTAVVATGIVLAGFLALWYAMPLRRRAHLPRPKV